MKNKLITKSSSKKQKLSILVLILLILILVFNINNLKKFYYQFYPMPENLKVDQWKEHQYEFVPNLPSLSIKYPSNWLVQEKSYGGHGLVLDLNSPWNKDNSKNSNYMHIRIMWDSKNEWTSSYDPLLSSHLDNKITDSPEYFIENQIDGYRSLATKPDKTQNNYVYIFTDLNEKSVNGAYIFRMELDYKTSQDPERVYEIYNKVVNSFKILE